METENSCKAISYIKNLSIGQKRKTSREEYMDKQKVSTLNDAKIEDQNVTWESKMIKDTEKCMATMSLCVIKTV